MLSFSSLKVKWFKRYCLQSEEVNVIADRCKWWQTVVESAVYTWVPGFLCKYWYHHQMSPSIGKSLIMLGVLFDILWGPLTSRCKIHFLSLLLRLPMFVCMLITHSSPLWNWLVYWQNLSASELICSYN